MLCSKRSPAYRRKLSQSVAHKNLNPQIFAVRILSLWLLWSDRSELYPPLACSLSSPELWGTARLSNPASLYRYLNRCLWDFLPFYQLIITVNSYLIKNYSVNVAFMLVSLNLCCFSHYYFLILTSGIKKDTPRRLLLDWNNNSPAISFLPAFLLLSASVWALGHGWLFIGREGI